MYKLIFLSCLLISSLYAAPVSFDSEVKTDVGIGDESLDKQKVLGDGMRPLGDISFDTVAPVIEDVTKVPPVVVDVVTSAPVVVDVVTAASVIVDVTTVAYGNSYKSEVYYSL
jgi:hypothetical protein